MVRPGLQDPGSSGGRGIDDPYHDQKTSGPNVFDPRVVAQMHRGDDLDVAKDAHHHTVGMGSAQSAAGNHIHNGSDSPQLLAGVTLTGAKGGNAALASVCAALAALGATDTTTA
jgi:hypothetical protein